MDGKTDSGSAYVRFPFSRTGQSGDFRVMTPSADPIGITGGELCLTGSPEGNQSTAKNRRCG
jgi:hypothetical protein